MLAEPACAMLPSQNFNFDVPVDSSFQLSSSEPAVLIARRRRRKKRKRRRRKPRYAYSYNFFMMKAPNFDKTPLPAAQAEEIKRAFHRGKAGKYPPNLLVRAGLVKHYPMKGGIFHRREPVKYLIMHSTETARPADATRVIRSWSNRGRRHPGAQYVVDRDGTIYMAVDPRLSTVHVNIFKTLKGINNDNSIGIEMVHSGKQKYEEAQVASVVKLATYLREYFGIPDKRVITHKYAQQGHHTDPVNFAWKTFLAKVNKLRNRALFEESQEIVALAESWRSKPESVGEKQEVKTSIKGEVKVEPVGDEGKEGLKPGSEPAANADAGTDNGTDIHSNNGPGTEPTESNEPTEVRSKGSGGQEHVDESPSRESGDATEIHSDRSSAPGSGLAPSASRPELRGPIEVGAEHAEKLHEQD